MVRENGGGYLHTTRYGQHQGSMQKIEMLVHYRSGWMWIPETKYTIMSTMGGWVQAKVHNGLFT